MSVSGEGRGMKHIHDVAVEDDGMRRRGCIWIGIHEITGEEHMHRHKVAMLDGSLNDGLHASR
jgi:hypothetical protein